MIPILPDLLPLVIVVAGAFAAGFISGLAGFGTALIASGFWFHALPASMVPPLIVLVAVAAQLTSFRSVRKSFDWRRVTPFLIGGLAGVPLGVLALAYASPTVLRPSVGIFLCLYATLQLLGLSRLCIPARVNRLHDGAVGVGGGFLGGFAGLSGPLPLIWLQLKGGPSDMQRAIYQPFNLVVLVFAGVAMTAAGQVTRDVWLVAAVCLPAVLAGTVLGTRIYKGVSEKRFQAVVLVLLLVSGLMLVAQAAFG